MKGELSIYIENGMDVLVNDPTLLFLSFVIFMVCLTVGVVASGDSDHYNLIGVLLAFTAPLVVLTIIIGLIISVVSENQGWPTGSSTICTAFMSIGGSFLVALPLLVKWIDHEVYIYKRRKAENLARESKQLNNNLKKNVGRYND